MFVWGSLKYSETFPKIYLEIAAGSIVKHQYSGIYEYNEGWFSLWFLSGEGSRKQRGRFIQHTWQ